MRDLIVAALLVLPAFAGPATVAPAAAEKIADQFIPAAFERQRIEGILGDRMRVNLEGRLLRVDEKASSIVSSTVPARRSGRANTPASSSTPRPIPGSTAATRA